ncbi:MAG: PIN domain-containing protein [Micropruina sp.]|uniref:PIN domain-containing protein n=1 Tax=Micropruina sp. TaxID=2737536 RepID=UPI0039E27132
MTDNVPGYLVPVRLVLGDANVLYSRVLRDYLLYAASQQLIQIFWSREILSEVVEHLIKNVDRFDAAAGERLIVAMNDTFPRAEARLTAEAIAAVAGVPLPDEGDRHVLAAAISAEVDVVCTSNIKDFPPEVMKDLGLEALTPDELLSALVLEFGPGMMEVHRVAVARLPGATNESTIHALKRAGATRTADLMASLLA